MSVGNKYITIPDTLSGAIVNIETMPMPESLFVHLEGFYFDTSNFVDEDFWHDNLGLNIFPLHDIEEFTPEDIKNTLSESIQDFSWKSKKGKYRHRLTFNWSMAYHQMLTELSSSRLYVIYAASNILRAVDDNGKIRGFEISAFEFEPFNFSTNNSPGNSELFIEHVDSNELNKNGYQVEVDWMPKRMDRLPVSIKITFKESSIGLEVRYLNNLVSGIKASDITIYDKINGYVDFSTFVPGNGYYGLSNFNKKITAATLFIKSRLYIGCKSFLYYFITPEENEFLLMSGENFLLMDNTNFLLMGSQKNINITDTGNFVRNYGLEKTFYVKITDKDGKIITNLKASYFTTENGKIKYVSHFGSGIYRIIGELNETGTFVIDNGVYNGSYDWDVTSKVYEVNMEVMNIGIAQISGKITYIPPQEKYTFDYYSELTNPDGNKWTVKTVGDTNYIALLHIPRGTGKILTINIDVVSITGSIIVESRDVGSSDTLKTITASGATTINYIATKRYLYFLFNGEVTINSISVNEA